MSANTKIEWCDHSWSPWRGCTKVSPGCANCYAETLSKRNPAVLGQWGKGKPRVLAKNWNEPLRWNRKAERDYVAAAHSTPVGAPIVFHRPTVFPSLCDWLDGEVPVEWLARFLKLIHDTPNLTWLLLTKRPENWEPRLRLACAHLQSDFITSDYTCDTVWQFCDRWLPWNGVHRYAPPANVWVGTSVEDQQRADDRIPALLKIPAVGRFLSLEPLLGPVDLRLPSRAFGFPKHITKEGHAVGMPQGIHWLIIGGESGPGARPCNVEWIRSLVAQGKVAGVPTFVKQLGRKPVTNTPEDLPTWSSARSRAGGPLGVYLHTIRHPKGGEPTEWPHDLRVREFPEGLR